MGPRSASLTVALVIVLGASPSGAQCPEQKVTASDGAANDFMGSSVALTEQLALVGSGWDDNAGGQDAGAVHAYRHDGSTWVGEAKLVAADGGPSSHFGAAVSLSGNRALIGAFGDDEWGNNGGAVHVFSLEGSTWVEEAKFAPADVEPGDSFGAEVSLEEKVALISSDRVGPGAEGEGAAYIFRSDGAAWSEEARLVPGDSTAADVFARSLSLSRDVALVSAFRVDPAGGGVGSVVVFRQDGGSWTEEATLIPSEVSDAIGFGSSVVVDGDVALVGAPIHDAGGMDGGAVYVFRHDGSEWFEEARLMASDTEESDFFGGSVALSLDVALVGAPYKANGTEALAGATYTFRFDGLAWAEESKLLAGDGSAQDLFGRSVAAAGNTALVGAGQDDDSAPFAGSAYFFDCTLNAPCALTEISPPGLGVGTGAFVVGKQGMDLRLSWQSTPMEAGVYMGTLEALRRPGFGYDHAATGACRLSGTETILTGPTPKKAYFLVIAAGCAGPRVEGPVGDDSEGRGRPTATDLGLTACP